MNHSGASKPTFGGYNPALGKRKVPSASPGVKLEPGVKQEPGLKLEGGDAKRSKSGLARFFLAENITQDLHSTL